MPLPPIDLTACAPAPELPAAPLTDRGLASYILRLDAAGEDCRSTLRALDEWMKDAKDRIEKERK